MVALAKGIAAAWPARQASSDALVSGTLVVALALPRVLDRVTDRAVMMIGAVALVAGMLAAVAMTSTGLASWAITVTIWVVIGAGMALIVTPTGRVIRASVRPSELPAAFAAQFSLSHMAWLLAYPMAGWVGTAAGFTWAWSILAALGVVGAVTAVLVWPRTAATVPRRR